jgi:hypothetical protein
MTHEAAIRTLPETPADLAVQAVALRGPHGDVARERVEQAEVRRGVVANLPIEAANEDGLEQPGAFDLVTVVREFLWPPPSRIRWQPLADLVVEVLDLARERIAAFREHVRCAPKRKVAPRAQQLPSPRVARRRIKPVPGRRSKDEIEPLARRGRQFSNAPSMIAASGKSTRLLRAAAASAAPSSMHVIRKPRRASGIVALPVAQPISKSTSPALSPAARTSAS